MTCRNPSVLLPLLLAFAGCTMATRTVKQAPLDQEGELWVYLQPLPAQAERLEFTLEAVLASKSDGAEVPLTISLAEVTGRNASRQRLLARGRVPAGEYAGLLLRVKKVALGGEGGAKADLLPPAEPVKVSTPFRVDRGRARVLVLELQYARSFEKGFGFKPDFSGAVPAMPLVERLGFVSNTGSDAVTVFDQRTRRAVAVLATGRDPRGMAIDPLQARLYVALGGEDQVAAYDLVTGAELARARLQPGDRPTEIGLTPDGKLLVTTNTGSSTASFVDPFALVELSRVRTGQEPTALLVDRGGRRAYAFNRATTNVTVLDTGTRSVAGTFPLEGEPARAALNRAGDRMYVVSPMSAYMAVLAVPSMAVLSRIYVGFRAVSVHVNPRNDYVYVAQGGDGAVQVFSPMTPLPVDRWQLPGEAVWMATDAVDDLLFAVVPSTRETVGVEQTGRRVLPGFDVGDDPYAVILAGPRD
jgi:DNA-binding beta-propeller fold protein YncE